MWESAVDFEKPGRGRGQWGKGREGTAKLLVGLYRRGDLVCVGVSMGE